ncbi:MAG: DUF6799 domain-containing protein [Bacteroidota bacterium]
MKNVTSIITLLLFTSIGIFAQDTTSGTSSSSGSNRWSDTSYARRNRATYDSLLRIHRGYWNEDSGYYIRSTGDTIRPYGRSEWMRDSINFESRNWDSTYQGRDRWGSESGIGNDQSGTSGTGNMGTGTGTQSGTTGTGMGDSARNQSGNQSQSGNQNQSGNQSQTGNQMDTTGSQSGTTSGNLGNQSTSNNSNNQSDQTTDRKTSTTSDVSGSTTTNSSSRNMNDRVYMKGKQLMVSRNGKSTRVLKSIRLHDGTVVLANGTIQMPDGNTMKLKSGESISLNQKSKKSNSNNSSENNQQ